jgi:hypothetical protein
MEKYNEKIRQMFLKNFMEFHGKFHGIQWNSMEISMEFHGISWNSMENSMN